MTTENQEQTTEAATATADKTSTQTTEKEVTLDDVYRDAGLDKTVAREVQQTTTQETKTDPATKIDPSSVPDPYDTERFKDWAARQAAGTDALGKAFHEVRQFLTAQQQKAQLEALKADVEKSVKAIDEIAQIGKPTVVEAYLDGMVRQDPRMKALWDNRGKNPAAWNNALKVVAKKMSEEFSVKVDPELQKAQRARKEAQKQMATTADDETTNQDEDRLGKAQGADFSREWESYIRGWN